MEIRYLIHVLQYRLLYFSDIGWHFIVFRTLIHVSHYSLKDISETLVYVLRVSTLVIVMSILLSFKITHIRLALSNIHIFTGLFLRRSTRFTLFYIKWEVFMLKAENPSLGSGVRDFGEKSWNVVRSENYFFAI